MYGSVRSTGRRGGIRKSVARFVFSTIVMKFVFFWSFVGSMVRRTLVVKVGITNRGCRRSVMGTPKTEEPRGDELIRSAATSKMGRHWEIPLDVGSPEPSGLRDESWLKTG